VSESPAPAAFSLALGLHANSIPTAADPNKIIFFMY